MNRAIPPAAFLAVTLLSASNALGENAGSAATAQVWSYRLNATMNVLPSEPDYLQPTLAADRGSLHLESRYNYEDRESASAFVGWNYETETATQLRLALTPMFGAVVGKTGGAIPALELTLGVPGLELYSESEYVLDSSDSSDSFFYNWSEVAFSATDWISAGLVMQRSRLIHNSREIQGGPMVRLTRGSWEGAAYFFNPGSEEHYFVASIALTFPFQSSSTIRRWSSATPCRKRSQ
jgi:hypothetical protein